MDRNPKYLTYLVKHLIIPAVFAGLNLHGIYAQEEVYKTSSGLLIIKANFDGQIVNINSRKLLILLDYETGKVVMKQEFSALTSENDSIQSKLNIMKNEYIQFEGKLGLDYINTLGHPPLKFHVEGTMYPGNNHVLGTGHLEHIGQGATIACLLSLTFKLRADDVFPDHFLEGFDNEIYVTVLQSLLPRVGD